MCACCPLKGLFSHFTLWFCDGVCFLAVSAINNLYITLGAPSLHRWLAFGGDPCGEKWQGVVCDSSNITEMYTSSSSSALTLCYHRKALFRFWPGVVIIVVWLQKDTRHEGGWKLKWHPRWFFIYPSHVSIAFLSHLHASFEASCLINNIYTLPSLFIWTGTSVTITSQGQFHRLCLLPS